MNKSSHVDPRKQHFKQITKEGFKKMFLNQELIAEGTQGQVYKAEVGQVDQPIKDKFVAIKYFKPEFLRSQKIKYIIEEINLLKKLKNQFLTNFIEAYKVKNGPIKYNAKYCIILEYCQTSLADYDLIKKLSIEKKWQICRDIVTGVDFIHNFNIMHRDLKPQNVLIKDIQNLNVKIADLGCSKEYIPDELTTTVFAGTPLYADPLIQHEQYTIKCDVFSLGLLIIYIFFGSNIFTSSKKRPDLYKKQKQSFKDMKRTMLAFFSQVDKNNQQPESLKKALIEIATKTITGKEDNRFSSGQLLNYIEKIVQKNKEKKQTFIDSKASGAKNLMNKVIDTVHQNLLQNQRQNVYLSQQTSSITRALVDFGQKMLSRQSSLQNSLQLDKSRKSLDQSIKMQQKSEIEQDEMFYTVLSNKMQQPYYDHLKNEELWPLEQVYSMNQSIKIEPQSMRKKQNNIKVIRASFNDNYKNNQQSSFSLKIKQKSHSFFIKNQQSQLINSKDYLKSMRLDNISTKPTVSFKKQKIKLKQTQKLCASLITTQFMIKRKIQQKRNLFKLIELIQMNRFNFQKIKCIQQSVSFEFKIQQKECIVFLFHYLYMYILRSMEKFLNDQSSEFTFYHKVNQKSIDQQGKIYLISIVRDQIYRKQGQFNKLSISLYQKLSLIQNKISQNLENIIRNNYFQTINGKFYIYFDMKNIKDQLKRDLRDKSTKLKSNIDQEILQTLINLVDKIQ